VHCHLLLGSGYQHPPQQRWQHRLALSGQALVFATTAAGGTLETLLSPVAAAADDDDDAVLFWMMLLMMFLMMLFPSALPLQQRLQLLRPSGTAADADFAGCSAESAAKDVLDVVLTADCARAGGSSDQLLASRSARSARSARLFLDLRTAGHQGSQRVSSSAPVRVLPAAAAAVAPCHQQ